MKKILIILAILILLSSGLLSGCVEEDDKKVKTPLITWETSQDSIIISEVDADTYYNPNSLKNNIIIKDISIVNNYYINENLALTGSTSGLSTKIIETGDEITGFNSYHNYSFIWGPSNKEIGKISFEIAIKPIATLSLRDESANVTINVETMEPNVPWSDIKCKLTDISTGVPYIWQGIESNKKIGDGIIDYEIIDDGDLELSAGDKILLGFSTNPADNLIEEDFYSFSITYTRIGEEIGSISWK